jgi:prophage regulatory protein
MATIWRLPSVRAEYGKGRTSIYEDIHRGLMTKPVRLGARAVGWPADEVKKITAARVAGKDESEIRSLVTKLEDARKEVTA